MLASTVNHLEYVLHRHKVQLCTEAAERFMQTSASDCLGEQKPVWSMMGAEFTHNLVVVTAAMYPGEVSLRDQLRWASIGFLPQHGVGYSQLTTMLESYFSAAREILSSAAGLDTLEAFITRILAEVFLTDSNQ